MNLFRRKPLPPPIPRLPWSSLTLAEWRDTPARVEYARKLFADPTFQEMLAVVQNTLKVRPPTETAELELGRALGHQDAITLFCSLCIPAPTPITNTFIEETYPNQTLETD